MKDSRYPTVNLSTVARLLRTRFDQRAAEMGMTLAQWRTLKAVRSDEGATQRRIAAILEVGDVTAGRLVDKLVEEGLLERRQDPADRRAYRLYVTPAVEPLFEKVQGLVAEEEKRIFAGLEDAELAALAGLLDRIMANMADPVPDLEPCGS